MKKLFVIIGVAFTLSGCYQQVNNSDLRKALQRCQTVDNIEYISAHVNGDETVKCLDAPAYINLSRIVVK